MRIFLLFFLLIFNTQPFGQQFPTNYISPSNVQWSNAPLPSDIKSSRDLLNWYKLAGQEKISKWSFISLLSDKKEQVILQGSSQSAGGINFLVLTRRNGAWERLIDIHGGFIFYPVPSNSPSLIIYQKSGLEYFRTEYVFKDGAFKKMASSEVPIELTRLNNSPINFHKFFWFMNGSFDK